MAPEDTDIRAAAYRAAGLIPSWEIVHRDGQDVTAEHPSTWPWPWSMYAAGGRGEAVQAEVWALHEEAVLIAGASNTGDDAAGERNAILPVRTSEETNERFRRTSRG